MRHGEKKKGQVGLWGAHSEGERELFSVGKKERDSSQRKKGVRAPGNRTVDFVELRREGLGKPWSLEIRGGRRIFEDFSEVSVLIMGNELPIRRGDNYEKKERGDPV